MVTEAEVIEAHLMHESAAFSFEMADSQQTWEREKVERYKVKADDLLNLLNTQRKENGQSPLKVKYIPNPENFWKKPTVVLVEMED